ncbi:unnamed protein product [Gordionus sp. m RMFG-2023]|uniref:synaptic vesicle 2-related protein-like n=1 Tax=Gordionus sp. m RMFG-2023 TaxID=3053472 RepID=UPI0030E512DC
MGESKNSRLRVSYKEIEDTYTVEQAIEMLGFGMFQIKLSLLTGLAWMSDAMEMMILSILSPALHCSWGLLAWQRALITTAVFIGMMISSTFWGKICDRFGRKTALFMCSLFTFYFGFLSSFSPTFLWLILLRGLTGFGIGGAPQSITLYSEFLPSKYRAKCLILIEIFWGLGTCLEVLLALIVMPTLGWPWLLAFSSLPLLVFSCFSLELPESARYHVACKDFESAYKIIERIARENKRPLPIGTLVEDDVVNQPPSKNPSTFSDTTDLLDTHRGRFKDLFATNIRITTFLLWIIWMVNAFSYYGIVLMTTELFESGDKCHGGTSKHLSPSCMLDCHPLQRSDYVDLLWTTLAEFPGLFSTVFMIEILGRKITIAIEFFAFSIFVFLLNICSNRTMIKTFIFIARAVISACFQATYVYTPEVYPTTIRAMGVGTCSMMARVGAILTPFVAQVLLKTSVRSAIDIYAASCIIAGICALFLPIETKGREMKDTVTTR